MNVGGSNGGVVEVRDGVMETVREELSRCSYAKIMGNILFPDIAWQEHFFTIEIHVWC